MGKEDILLQMNHISKSFGKAVIALSDVQLELRKGEVLALLGENGAGKAEKACKAVCRSLCSRTTLNYFTETLHYSDKGMIIIIYINNCRK